MLSVHTKNDHSLPGRRSWAAVLFVQRSMIDVMTYPKMTSLPMCCVLSGLCGSRA